MVLLFVFLILLGPKGLQQALRGFKDLVGWMRSVSQKLREESQIDLSSTGLTDLDLSEFDLGQYNPREIIRQAVREEMDAWVTQVQKGPTITKPSDLPSPNPGKIELEPEQDSGSA